MAERIVRVSTSQETLNKFAKDNRSNSFLSRYVADRDSVLVEGALIEAGLLQAGDILVVSFVVDTKTFPDDLSKKIKVYTARKTLDGKFVPTSFMGEFFLDIEFDRDN